MLCLAQLCKGQSPKSPPATRRITALLDKEAPVRSPRQPGDVWCQEVNIGDGALPTPSERLKSACDSWLWQKPILARALGVGDNVDDEVQGTAQGQPAVGGQYHVPVHGYSGSCTRCEAGGGSLRKDGFPSCPPSDERSAIVLEGKV